jgi:succinate dehydrogenase/fumarate reductase flavoprotein subunit
MYGSTRLGTNSLPDLLVFGRVAAERATEIKSPAPHGAAACRDGSRDRAAPTGCTTRRARQRPDRSTARCNG